MWSQRIFLVLVFYSIFGFTYSRNNGFQKPVRHHLSQLTTKDGLTGNRTRCLLQDQKGEIWIGTQNGLNRYDGYQIIRYQRNPENPFSLPDNFIHSLALSPSGNIWIGTARAGLCRYDPRQDQFHQLIDLDGKPVFQTAAVKSLFVETDSSLWIGTSKGLCHVLLTPEYFVQSQTTFSYDRNDPNSISRGMVMSIQQTDPRTLWIGTYHDGLNRIVLDADTTITRFTHDPQNPNSLNHDYLHQIQLDKQGNLWVGTGYGAYRIDHGDLLDSQPAFHQMDPLAFGMDSPYTESVNGFSTDQKGNFWLISNTHLHRYIPENDSLFTYSPSELNIKSKGANVFFSMLIDRENRIWTTSMEGVYYESGNITSFQSFHLTESGQQSGLLVRAIETDSLGNIWVGTESRGITVLNSEGKTINRIQNLLPSEFVTEIYCDQQNRIWVGLFRGGLVLVEATAKHSGQWIDQQITRFSSGQLNSKDIEDIFEDRNGNIWLASLQGLHRWDSAKQKFSFYRARWGNEVAQTTDGTIWLATSMGLYQYEATGDSIRKYQPAHDRGFNLKKQIFLTIFADDKGYLWAGTPHGLYRIKEGEADILYHDKKGLGGNLVKAIQQDQKGNLWISTQNGLSKFDPTTEEFSNYYYEDGLTLQNFTERASKSGHDGTLFFGGEKGIIRFHPDSIQLSDLQPVVLIKDIKLFNQSIRLHWRNDQEIEKSIQVSPPYLKEMTFRHKEKSFSIEFAALAFGYTHRTTYRYRLVGFESDWITLSPGQRSATYTNLDPGKYSFQVQASLDGKSWNKQAISLEIIVNPPWYRTWWAMLLYGFLGSLLIFLALYVRIRQVEKRYQMQAHIAKVREEERDAVRKRSARDFHDEAGNRLTKLSLYTELTKRLLEQNEEASRYLNQIESNLGALSSGMRDFIWVLNPENDSLADTLKRILTFGNSLFEHSPTQFVGSVEMGLLEEYKLDLKTKRHLLLIFKEAMNNTLKYAKADSASLQAEIEKSRIILTYQDNGIGFAQNQISQGNGLHNMRNRAEEIGAFFSIISRNGEGTTIQCAIDITQMEDSFS